MDTSADPSTSSEVFQDPPRLANPFTSDALLRSYLKRHFGADAYAKLAPQWKAWGERVAGELRADGEQAEAEPPELDVDRLELSDGWKSLEAAAAQEGLIAIAYERKHGAKSRLDQFARLYLYGASSAFQNCALAMTDGAARAIELHGSDELRTRALSRLTSRDPEAAWTSGQWMTERTGGSDVSGTATVARRQPDGTYRLFGEKWFTSAAASPMAMTLARIEGANEPGTRGLSLFYVETHDDRGRFRDLTIRRLKDKLGTRALPTAELTLTGATAILVGEPGAGVRTISTLFNITRIHNAVAALSTMQRGIALARDWASRRVTFGHRLSEHPLHLETLAALETERVGAFLISFRAAELLGRSETGEASEEEVACLRLLTPLAKLLTAKVSIAACSEVVELFGGAGYCEDSGIPRLLRDAQVYSIWEGTTNVLSLDVRRAIEKEAAFEPFLRDLLRRLARVRSGELAGETALVSGTAGRLAQYSGALIAAAAGGPPGPDFVQGAARAYAFALARAYQAALALDHADYALVEKHEEGPRFAEAARRLCREMTAAMAELPPVEGAAAALAATRGLALGG